MCGDFNMIYNNDLENIAGAPHSNREGGNFLNFPKVLKLEDSWRFLNNNTKEFMWSRNAPYAARRLDYIICGVNVAEHLTNSEIIEYPRTEYKAVMAEIQMDTFPRGPPRWHFNLLHLKDKTFLHHMTAFIDECLEANEKEGVDSRTSWELLKASIRAECIEFGRKKKVEEQQLGIHNLENEVKELTKKIVENPNKIELQYQYEACKKRLEIELMSKTKGL